MEITNIGKIELHSDEKLNKYDVIFDDLYKAMDSLKVGNAIRIKADFPIYGWEKIIARYKNSRNIKSNNSSFRIVARVLNTEATEHVVAKLLRKGKQK